MIGIKLSGGLGNNMFGYAAAKSLATKKNVNLCFFSQKDYRFFIKSLKKHILFLIFGKKDKISKQILKRELNDYFELEENWIKLLLRRTIWLLNFNKRSILEFENSIADDSNTKDLEKFIKKFNNSEKWTELRGGFFSEKFFLNRKFILNCFTPKKTYRQKISNLEKTFYLPPEKRCCIHIRRGDALFADKGFDYKGIGWTLPESYYEHIIKKLGFNLLYIFISDEPEWAEGRFKYLPNKIILKNNIDIVDMFIFSKCKYNIISRSTFSWWGAWLNQIKNKVVFAPKYFIGINQKICYPVGMDQGNEVEKWNYVDIERLK